MFEEKHQEVPNVCRLHGGATAVKNNNLDKDTVMSTWHLTESKHYKQVTKNKRISNFHHIFGAEQYVLSRINQSLQDVLRSDWRIGHKTNWKWKLQII